MRARLAHATAAAPRSAWPPQSRPQASWPRAWTCSSCARRPFASQQQQQQQHMAAGDRKPYYITTPIFYVNAAPHVGHLYTLVLTDILKRWRVLKGETALMCTGTDEHGLKVQRASAKAGIDPQLFCDQGAALFKELAARALVSHDHFVRTTDADHKDAVAYAWFLLHEKGLIYTKKHEGWYSVADEAFYPPSAVQPHLDPPTGRKIMVSVETRSEVEWSSEENYHFRLSHFRGPLLQFYRENPEWITPAHRMKDVVHAVESGLEDLSISRPSERLAWGIRVPQDSSQTIYVWLDALINYVTKAGYPWAPGRDHAGGWPADCHVIGKDIVRFHCIYWPAFLMALGLPLPKRILTHAHWTLGGSKMSKSTGRVVDPFLALDRFGPDVMRCYLAHDGGIQDDGNYDNTQIIKLYNNLLWAQLGNLLSRVTRGKKWSVRGAIQRIGPLPASDWANDQGSEFHSTLLKFPSNVAESLDAHDPRRAIRIIADLIRSSNQYVQVSAPWQKILDYGPGEPGEEVDRIVYLAAEALRMAGILLQPYMPNKAKTMLDQLGVDDARRTFEYCAVGRDLHYGAPTVELGVKYEGALFPPLSSEE